MPICQFTVFRRLCILLLPVIAASCGGGADGMQAGTGPAGTSLSENSGSSMIHLTLTQPADREVLSASEATPVSANLTIDGSKDPDGVAVQFSTVSGSLAPTRAAVIAGVATSSLSGTTPGRQQLIATAQTGAITTSATRVFFTRPAPAPLEVLVPAYFSSSDSVAWGALTSGVAAHPDVPVTVIFNPSNGIFTTADAEYARALKQIANSGGRSIGYVYTRYGGGSRSLDSIKANIDNYLTKYPGVITGFFLDEMASNAEQLMFYRKIYQYIKSKNPDLRVIGNPGSIPNPVYANVVDVLVTFEGKGATFSNYDPRLNEGWLYQYINSRQSALIHNVGTCAAMQTTVLAAATANFNTGPLYVTDSLYQPATGAGNPWGKLPTYWTGLLQAVSAVNQGRNLPACV